MNSKNKKAMTVDERAHVDKIKQLPCSVCNCPGPSDAHEINQGEWFTSVALCKSCHQDDHNGIHGRRAMWNVMKLTEIGALGVTIKRLMK